MSARRRRRKFYPCFGNPLHLGYAADGSKIIITPKQRSSHISVTGKTGSGKTKALEYYIWQDVTNFRWSGSPVVVFDGHGDLTDAFVRRIAMFPALQRLPVIIIDLRSDERVVSYNVLRHRDGVPPSVVSSNIVDAIGHVMRADSVVSTPKFAQIAGALFHALYEAGLGIDAAFGALDARNSQMRAFLMRTTKNDMVRSTLAELGDRKGGSVMDEVSSTRTRLWQILNNPRIRRALGDSRASLDLLSAIKDGAIIFVCTPTERAKISDRDGDVFASLVLSDLWMTCRQRGKSAAHRPVYAYLDEFQTYVNPSITRSLDQARGFGLHLCLSHQYPAQLRDAGEIGNALYRSVMQNTGNTVVFNSLSEEDLDPLSKKLFTGVVNPDLIKHVMTSTKVVNYVDERIESFSEGRTESQSTHRSRGKSQSTSYGHSKTSGRGSGSGTGLTHQGGHREVNVERYDENGDLIDESMTISDSPVYDISTESTSSYESGSETDTDAESETESESEGEATGTANSVGKVVSYRLRPILGTEVTAIEYRSIEEQFFLARQAIFRLPKRHALVRLDEELAPRLMVTASVAPPLARPPRVERALDRMASRLRFVSRPDDLGAEQALRVSSPRSAAPSYQDDDEGNAEFEFPSPPSLPAPQGRTP